MTTLTTFLLMIALVSLLGVLLSRFGGRIGMPSLVLFMALGLLFGSEGLLKIPFDNYSIAESTCSVALLFIMFSGGFETNWKTAKTAAKPGIWLSVAGVIITAGITGVFCHFALGMPWLEGLLVGAVIRLNRRSLGVFHSAAEKLKLKKFPGAHAGIGKRQQRPYRLRAYRHFPFFADRGQNQLGGHVFAANGVWRFVRRFIWQGQRLCFKACAV